MQAAPLDPDHRRHHDPDDAEDHDDPEHDDDVRSALLDRYEELSEELPSLRRAWVDRADALRSGEITVEPGWMLRPILGETIEVFGLYRVYGDGRVERDRLIERAERERFRSAPDRFA